MSLNLRFISALGAVGLTFSVQAEYAVGVLEGPEPRQYTQGLHKDWQEGITREPVTGNYIVTYRVEDEAFASVIFVPSNKIRPYLRSHFDMDDDDVGNVAYTYSMKNARISRQNIISLSMTASSIVQTPNAPIDWATVAVPGSFGRTTLTWTRNLTEKEGLLKAGLKPGQSQGGFKLKSGDLPGIAAVEMRGNGSGAIWLGHYPQGKVGEQIAKIEQDNFVHIYAAVPRIPVPTPWDAGTVLANIRTHINTDMVSMQLIDLVFANELNRLFTAAIEAAKHNNDKGVKENLKDIRKALKKAHRDMDDEDNHARKHRHRNNDDSDDWEHTDPKQKPKPVFIDKLAARVLDFDVKYVLGRLGKTKED